MTQATRIEIGNEFTESLKVHKNLDQEVIVTTIDKVRICLMRNSERMQKQRDWITPLGILVPLGATIVAADFKDFFLPRQVWEAIYILSTFIVLAWLIKAVVVASRLGKKTTIDTIIDELKPPSNQQQ